MNRRDLFRSALAAAAMAWSPLAIRRDPLARGGIVKDRIALLGAEYGAETWIPLTDARVRIQLELGAPPVLVVEGGEPETLAFADREDWRDLLTRAGFRRAEG